MATGRKAFDGQSQASLIASILTEQPEPISSTHAAIDAASPVFALDHVVDRCLAKSPDARWQTMRDVLLELEWTSRAGARRRRLVRSGARFSARGVGMGSGGRCGRRGLIVRVPSVAQSRRTGDTLRRAGAPGTTIGIAESRTRIAISPDGRRLAMVAAREGTTQIWVRSLDSVTSEPVPGTEGAVSPFWSPDSRFLAFFSSVTGS